MDEEQKNLNEEINEEELDTSTGNADESQEDESEEEVVDESDSHEEEDDDQQEEDEEERPVSKRENKRINQLLERLKSKEESGEGLTKAEKAERKRIIDEGDYDLDEINDMAGKYGDSRYEEGLRTAQQQVQNALTFNTRLELDVPKVASKYDFLDQDSDNFDPGRATFINEMYLRTVGFDQRSGTVKNTDIRYHEFVDGIMELVDVQASAKESSTRKNFAKQAAKTGVRPAGVSKPYNGDDPSKMTTEQLNAAIASSLKGIRR